MLHAIILLRFVSSANMMIACFDELSDMGVETQMTHDDDDDDDDHVMMTSRCCLYVHLCISVFVSSVLLHLPSS